MSFQNILLAIDDSKFSQKATGKVVELARLMGSKVSIVHVVLPVRTVAHYERLLPMFPEVNEVYDDIGRSILDEAAGQFPEDMEVETVLLHGNPALEIIELSKEGFDLLVIGGHGSSGGPLFSMGSVVSKVIYNSDLPVLIVK